MIVLKAAQIKVQKLKNDTNQMMAKKNQLQKQLQLTRDRLERASDLTRLTKDEASRWKQTVQNMKYDIVNMPLDVFVSAAAISYNGPFTGAYRKNLIDYWTTIINAKQIPISSDFQISRVLGDPLTIRDWIIQGLPSDSISIQNAIFSKEGNRWPLLIDPQNQALKWLNKMFQSKMKKNLNLNNLFFLSQMKSSIKNGLPVIISDVQQTLPAVLDTVFAKQIKMQQNMPMIKFGDQNIYYDCKFQMFIITKLANPNFLPEIFIRVNIINFTVTFNGLKEQLLAVVVKHQRQEIQQQRDENIVLMGQCNKTINQSELNILRLLKKAKSEAILDDIQLIDTLKESQQASKYIKIKMEQSKKLQESINLIRQQYSSVSTRGAILFFVIKDLSIIDTMYQYSLQYVQKIINISMQSADKSQKLEERLINLINQITFNLYKNVSRGLFQKDKTIFSFIIASSINRQARIIAEDIWSVFSRGPQIIDQSYFKANPSKTLFTNKAWQLANYLQHSFAKFIGLTSSFTNKVKQWEAFINEGNIFELYPDDWDNKLDLFDKILIWRIIQPQKIASALSYYISQTIGEKYLVSPNISLKDLWKDSDNRTPIIFVLSPGADPTNSLFKLTKQLNMDIQVISLGQGQGQPATRLISKAKISGKWVLLQNCHLAKTWMPQMQKIIEQNSKINTEIHENFRLYLTSMPAQYFPMSVLQNGIKLTTQPPRGIKANLKRSWNQIDEQNLRACPNKTESFHKLLWGLTFFHAIIQQRQKFGPLGWNIKYQFNESDLQTSKTVLQMLLNKSQVIPFQALLFVTGQINYGGRVTDDWDRRCLKTILSQFYTQQILSNKYQFSQSKQHIIPTFQSIQNYRSYIQALPLQEQTSVFGMHPNANITFYQQQQKQIMETLLNLQPRDSITSGKSSQDIILELVTSILDKKQVPQLFAIQHAHKDIFITNQKGLLSSLSTFLLQEIVRFNHLLKIIKTSLQDLKKAINGLILMSDQLDTMFYSLLLNKVPSNWSKVSYPSLKSMNSWLKDLKLRTGFINQWLNDGSVNSYWLSSFFFPQGFLTGVLQQYARQPDKQIAIDQLVFSFKFTDFSKQKCQNKPAQGIYIHGLYLEGGAWDYSKKILIEPIKNQISCIMPLINFIPLKIQQKKVNQKYEVYQCPVYKTSTRAGVLSTTGQSTNFVLSVQLPSIQQSQAWILQGTALLLQLNQ